MAIMMSTLKIINADNESLFSRPEVVDSEPLLPKIDPERLKKELKILEIAQAQGAAGIPAFNDTQLTDVEHQIPVSLQTTVSCLPRSSGAVIISLPCWLFDTTVRCRRRVLLSPPTKTIPKAIYAARFARA
jgi:hypothetical protein